MDSTIAVFLVPVMGVVLFWLIKDKDAKLKADLAAIQAQVTADRKDFELALKEQNKLCQHELDRQARDLMEDRKLHVDQVWNHFADQNAQLWAKHELDVRELVELRERIARDHYVKQELDAKFDKMERAITDGLKDVGVKIDKLAEALMVRREEDRHA